MHHDLKRIGSMFTNINLMFVLFFPYLNETIQDIVRATTFLILAAIILIWLTGNVLSIYERLYNSFLIAPAMSLTKKYMIMFILDIILHLIPFLILGFPYHGVSFLFAYGIMMTWYVLVRDRIGSIYIPYLPYDSSMLILGIIAALGSIL
jgi:heme/copper-type cytochrome/quinol oxidase subunit 4